MRHARDRTAPIRRVLRAAPRSSTYRMASRAGAAPVQRSRDQLLAAPAFALDQHGKGGGRRSLHDRRTSFIAGLDPTNSSSSADALCCANARQRPARATAAAIASTDALLVGVASRRERPPSSQCANCFPGIAHRSAAFESVADAVRRDDIADSHDTRSAIPASMRPSATRDRVAPRAPSKNPTAAAPSLDLTVAHVFASTATSSAAIWEHRRLRANLSRQDTGPHALRQAPTEQEVRELRGPWPLRGASQCPQDARRPANREACRTALERATEYSPGLLAQDGTARRRHATDSRFVGPLPRRTGALRSRRRCLCAARAASRAVRTSLSTPA